MGKNTGTVPMPHVCSLLDRCRTLPRSTAGQQAQQCVGLQPHLHDRLHHPDIIQPLRGHHAASRWLDSLHPDQSAQLSGLPLVQQE